MPLSAPENPDARFRVADPLLFLEQFCRQRLEQPQPAAAGRQPASGKAATELLLERLHTLRSSGEPSA
ncbi:MAG: hypothetical protein G8237_06140 [Magnetococcales bacterium]|nr:hypothetical protein [Magnetococcales bacterium]NGZ05920.1 hypothetical protein [Magnetococcales bacterium]